MSFKLEIFLMRVSLLPSLLQFSVMVSSYPLDPIGNVIKLPFPNDQSILGVGGLAYDSRENLWSASCENIASASHINNDSDVTISLPRLYHMNLNFEDASIEFLTDEPIIVQPSTGLKLEGLAIVPNQTRSINPIEKDIWLVSESHSYLAKTSKFLSKDYGPTDLTSFDPETFSSSRLVRVDGSSGEILEEVTLPSNVLWDLEYDWESANCIGERPFAGLHALSIVPSFDTEFTNIMFVAYQTALYQDGNSPTDFSNSATRILVYGLYSDNFRTSTTAYYLKSYRYDTSKLTLKSYQKSSSHFNALFGILALDEKSLLVAECEDLTTTSRQRIVNRIYYVELSGQTVDHCHSLLECDVGAPLKRLVWERDGEEQLDDITWGPILDDGRRSIALTFENDKKIGVHFELFALNEEELNEFGEIYDSVDERDALLIRRITAVSIAAAAVVAFFFAQFICIKFLQSKTKSENSPPTVVDEVLPPFNFENYALLSAMLNSFLVGGLTFGYSGMVLMLRKEGVYADYCSCGSFCAKQKEQLALISSIGFSAAVGSRLFIGLFMDIQGPKLTAIICSSICLSGFSILAFVSQDHLTSTFLPAWILLSVGGSGLHLTGFHFTNLFPGDRKKKASAFISAAFGASSAVFPIMQIFNQYLNVKIQSMMLFYTIVVSLLTINNLMIQPWSKVKQGESYIPNFNILRASWWKRDLSQTQTLSSVMDIFVKFDFYGEAFIYSVLLFLLTHYLSTTSQLMYEKGDVPFTSNPNDWSDFLFARTAGWFNALGFIWLPTVKYVITKFRWSQLYLFLCLLNICIVGIILINNLEIQILGFALLSYGRLMLFSCHHAYLIDVFGMAYFGTLNGISSFFAALLGFVSYPLQLIALRASYGMSFIPIGILVLMAIFVSLKRKKTKSVKENSYGLEINHDLENFDDDPVNKAEMIINWAETVSADSNIFRYPTSIDEVTSLVQSNSKIRCAGALHSCAPLIASEGIIMSLTKLGRIININADNMTVRCESGARIHDICDAIAPYNMALGTLGTIDWQTISGAVMTGTHGGALTIPSLHAFVTSYTTVLPDGKITTITKTSDPTLFSAMAPSMGVFGAVVEMEIQCVPLQILEARMEVIQFEDLTEVFETIMQSNKYARVVVYPSINKATIWTANPVLSRKDAIERGAVNSPGYTNFRDENEMEMLKKYLLHCEKNEYDKADNLLHHVLKSQMKRLNHYVGQYNHVLCKERSNGIPHADIEFNFDFRKNKEVIKKVKSYCDKNRVPYYNFELRTTKQDNAMLSCCQGRDAMWIDFQAKANVSREFFGAVETLLKPIGFRKHWAKGMDNTNPEYVLSQFPDVKKFLSLMKEVDPGGKFRNTQSEGWFRMMDAEVAKNTIEGDKSQRK